ncbi:MAG: hypothetical protein MN733_19030 [Nitrososphaera sp.]|nr:hypothetical protein [Nitrososphaera sp.]
MEHSPVKKSSKVTGRIVSSPQRPGLPMSPTHRPTTHSQSSTIQDGTVKFEVGFPEAGTYKVFTQFQHDGTVFKTDFVVSVGQPMRSPGTDTGAEPDQTVHHQGY